MSPRYYTVEDNYQAARMFADKGFLAKLDESGYKYELEAEASTSERALGICICRMTAERFEDISGVADLAWLNVYVNTGPESLLKAELRPKAETIADAGEHYKLFAERGYIDGEFPTGESR